MAMESSVSKAVRQSLIYSSITAVALSTGGFAVAAEEGADVERIEVTGSRIKRADMETASPVTVIDASSIKAEGYTSIDEVLQNQPAMAGLAVGSTTNNGADGVAQVDLRGMGANRTLVLLNGRRMVNSGSGADSAVDLNAIPVAMIQRIEVLKDGASAVYGSDAIAGVVNIITKRDFEGFNIDIAGDMTGDSDGENIEFSGLYGANTEKGNYTVGFSYTDRRTVSQADRDWVEPGASSFVPGGTLGGYVPNADGSWSERDFGYDYTETSYLQTPSTKYSLFANMVHEFDNEVVFTADALYTRRESKQQMAPQPANVMLNVCGEADSDGVVHVKPNCIDRPAGLPAAVEVDDEGRLNYRRRMVEVGPRIFEQETDTMRVSAALAGYLDINTGMDWELSYTYGRNRADTYVRNSVNAANLIDSIYQNSADWFTGNPDDIAQYVDDISYLEDSTGGNDQHVVAGVLSGELFELSAGAIGFAIGAEYRFEEGYFTPDPVIQAGEGTASQQDPTDGDYDVISLYQEISIPFTEKLLGEFALRYDEYSTFGKATTWKVGLTYEATDDLMLRTVVATGFRAPNVSELFGGNVGSYEYLTDPWGESPDPQILVNWTSDPDLDAEESESFTLGAVYSPSAIDGLSFTVDYWAFKIDDAIARRDVQQGLYDCKAGDTAACETFNIIVNGDSRDLTGLTNALTNVGTQDTSGIDFNVFYQFEGLGLEWSVNNDLTHLLEFEQDGNDYTGKISGVYGAYAEWKNQLSVTASHDDYSFTYSNRYIGSMDNYRSETVSEKIDSIMYHNVSGTFFINDNFSTTLGIRNLTDEDPLMIPYNSKDAGTIPEVYETIGRVYFASVNMQF
ncbi:TonB-dependent receptor plug domain-containing protein [Ferrimonas senticii]|uniref:TonB-dependent receptor plug domain-containing protein n=1 Tax=Ferrimonas senticii TaxID=394566 RepID=UPI00048243DC|nr:TonB-dependent receptor [Ferrimonas senticii]